MGEDAARAMRARIRIDLKQAMQDRRAAEIGVLRTLLAAIDDAQAPPPMPEQPYRPRDFHSGAAEAQRRLLTAEALRAVLEREAAQRRDAAAVLAERGRAADAARLEQEAGLVMRYVGE